MTTNREQGEKLFFVREAGKKLLFKKNALNEIERISRWLSEAMAKEILQQRMQKKHFKMPHS